MYAGYLKWAQEYQQTDGCQPIPPERVDDMCEIWADKDIQEAARISTNLLDSAT
jgi:hypothetical protein